MGKKKADNLSSLISSGGIVFVRLESTRAVDLELRGFVYEKMEA
jgi:hypothetical protein